ncbi:hypothetical protein C0991_010482 [Blastosporella zonata]|nr:hypothetical protein C0991_010482 [Blastosporella zonata]
MALRSHTKRARSPGSPGDRPNKRLSLAMDHFKNAHSSGNVTPQSPAGSSRFPSEDWVHQADGLTIDSPNIMGLGLPEDKDEDMVRIPFPLRASVSENMDPDCTNDTILPDPQVLAQRPDLPPIQTTQMNFAHAALFRHHQNMQLHNPLSATSSAFTPPGPIVTVLPPTPSISSSSTPVYMQNQPQTRPSTPVDDSSGSSAMLISSPTPLMGSFVSPRKQRFTMGPRSDCFKCQMNIKGHSVHY